MHCLCLKTHLVAITLLFCKATEIPLGWLKESLFSCLSIFVVPLILKTNIRKADNGASTTSIKIWKILYKVDLSCHGTFPYQTWLKICWLYRLLWMRVTHMFFNYLKTRQTQMDGHLVNIHWLLEAFAGARIWNFDSKTTDFATMFAYFEEREKSALWQIVVR